MKYLTVLALIFFGMIPLSGSEIFSRTGESHTGNFTLAWFTSEDGNTVEFRAGNMELEDADLRVSLILSNMAADVPLPYHRVIKAGSKETILFRIVRTGSEFRYNLNYRIFSGNPAATVSSAFSLPLPAGKSFTVGNAFHGFGAHKDMTPYAVDFSIPEGTPIHAAMDGVVVRIKSDSDKGGPDISFNDYANYIFILHDAGSIFTPAKDMIVTRNDAIDKPAVKER